MLEDGMVAVTHSCQQREVTVRDVGDTGLW